MIGALLMITYEQVNNEDPAFYPLKVNECTVLLKKQRLREKC